MADGEPPLPRPRPWWPSWLRSAWIGRPVYAVGDIHGRSDLLKVMIAALRGDAARLDRKPLIILMGDYIDRGTDSRGVIDEILALNAEPWCDVECLMGNHEYALLRFLHQPDYGNFWFRHGGLATLKSYGVTAPSAGPWEMDVLVQARDDLISALPRLHMRFLVCLHLSYQVDDYLFVHAGVRPGILLSLQMPEDLLWIREPFLAAARPADKVIVHGHTIHRRVVNKRWRIGVDTGAYASGLLSAICLDGTKRRVLSIR